MGEGRGGRAEGKRRGNAQQPCTIARASAGSASRSASAGLVRAQREILFARSGSPQYPLSSIYLGALSGTLRASRSRL